MSDKPTAQFSDLEPGQKFRIPWTAAVLKKVSADDHNAEIKTPTGIIPFAIPDHWDVIEERE